MRFFQMAAVPALSATLANAQNIPKKVTILTPLMGSTVGMKGMGWMMDVVAEFSASSAATSSAVATPSSGSSGGGGGYRRSNPTTDPDDGFFPFLNSPNLTTFGPGPNQAAPGFVCLLNTSSNPSQNFAGAFQLNAITNSDKQGNILEAYFSWFVGAPDFGSNANAAATVFFLKGAAPANYTGDPKTDPNIISNVATVTFSIFGDAASNATSASSLDSPLSITLFTPRSGSWWARTVLGLRASLPRQLHRQGLFPGASKAVPGLVVLSNSSTLPGGASTNLANLFQINAVTRVQDRIITEYWCTWFVGSPFAGINQPSSLTIFVVNGTAPSSVSKTMPSNIISNVMTVNFTLAGPSSASADSKGSTSSAGRLDLAIGSLVLGLLAFLF
ncbi:hypothetical protein ACCO45_009836 [Purpureocillium lilacinum]|uniref:Uncharacterized protein n=1 Tax=Purpureocillium lilacinum TaxID=33203 RepID=A0ACC4DNS6_PURLI